jgi:hypothetical protein
MKGYTPHPRKWRTLKRLIRAYAEAAIQDSWKGGRDPEDMPVIEARKKKARANLDKHIRYMQENL